MQLINGKVLDHRIIGPEYREMVLECSGIAGQARPGQFIHLLIPGLSTATLRRPFSIYRVFEGCLAIVYRIVGRGTEALQNVRKGQEISLMGPLGNGFPIPSEDVFPVLVGGGYGVAPLVFLADRLGRQGAAFVGGATSRDILCQNELRNLGFDVRIATEDGSEGEKGLVTDVLDRWIETLESGLQAQFFACGPDGMLKVVGDMALSRDRKAWLSLDRHMGCGLGACLACVQRIRLEDGCEVLKRVCRDGPVFEASHVIWDKG